MTKATRTFLREESSFSGSYSRGVFRAVWMAYQPWARRVAALLLLGLVARLLLLANTNIMGYWVDSFCRANCKPLPALLVGLPPIAFPALLATLTLLGFILNTLFRIAISRTGTHAVSLFYDEVTLRASRFPMSFFDATPVGRMLTRFSSDYAAIFRMAGGPMGEFLCLVFDLILMVVLTGVASPWFLPLVAFAILVNAILYRKNLLRLRTARRTVSRARSPAIAHFSETVQGAAVIRIFGREVPFISRFLQLVDEFSSVRLRGAAVLSGFSLQMTAAVATLVMLTGVAGLFLERWGRVSVGDIGVAFTFVMMSSNTVASFFDWLSNLEEALTGFERLDEYLRHPLEPGSSLPPEARFETGQPRLTPAEVKSRQEHPGLKSAGVVVSGLTMRYRPEFPLVLHDIDLHVPAGSHLGIVGRTGSGKSSLIQAIFHLYPFEKGDVSLDGWSPLSQERHMPLDVYRSQISFIPQEPLLFHGSLRDNLARSGELSDSGLLDLLELAGLQDLIALHGKGVLDMPIHERGSNLSLGQRQLVSLARALVRDTPIVVLDEATSAVDPASEARLVTTLRNRLAHKTRIVVAHRLSTLRDVDCVVWLDNGRVRLMGPPSEVLPVFQVDGHAGHSVD